MKKFKLIILFVLLAGLIFLASSGMSAGKVGFSLYDGPDVLFSKEYKISFKTRLEVFFFHKGDYFDYYEGLEDKSGALAKINSKLQNDVLGAVSSAEKPSMPATVVWDKKNFTYTDGVFGVEIDEKALVANIFAAFSKNFSVGLNKEPIPPSPTKEELQAATVRLSSFSTYFINSSPERKHNIARAAELLDGTVVGPGGVFSFNSTVGPRTVERGFQTAHIIENGKFIDGVGGGVCQVSTTLYNAALLAGADVTEVSRHSLPVSYVPLSFDAMVSSRQDLAFFNPTKYNIYISAAADDKKITFVFYGYPAYAGCKIVLRSETLRTIEKDEYEIYQDAGELSADQFEKVLKPPKCGYVSEGYLDVYKGGVLVSSKRIRKDTYMPQKGIKIIRAPVTAPEEKLKVES
jgi:Uncharacterized vancomycin resistance protein